LYSFDAIYRQFIQDEQFKLLERFCQAANHIAIHSQKLTEHMRKKYAVHRVKVAGRTFYVFPRQEIPPDVYYKVVIPGIEKESVGG